MFFEAFEIDVTVFTKWRTINNKITGVGMTISF